MTRPSVGFRTRLARFDVRHLARRFFQVLRPRPLTPAEQAVVARHLRPAERPLFWAQAAADQRHAFETMRRAANAGLGEVGRRAALLHDVGKAGVQLGAIGRSVATVLDLLGVRLGGAAAAYRRHGPLGAERLAAAGAEPLVVDFARRHGDPDPGPHDPGVWAALGAADDV